MATKTVIRHRSIHWFRKGLRLHDNPALLAAVNNSEEIWPVFVLDPWFVKDYKVGENRWRFLIQSLSDLDEKLKSLNGRLYVVRGDPKQVLPEIVKRWEITQVSFEVDTEPYAVSRDAVLEKLLSQQGVMVTKRISHTLYDTDRVIKKNGGVPPMTYQRCQSILAQLGPPGKPSATFDQGALKECKISSRGHGPEYAVPTLGELGVDEENMSTCLYPGGETEALARLEKVLKQTNWVVTFEKPKTAPNSLSPSTTVLSPYLKFGCLSVRTFYWRVQDIYAKAKKHSQPPVSLHGQLLWREFFYTVGYATDNFNRMQGNPICKQIPWQENAEHLDAWKNARTGYPFIDAIMVQLKREGWIHHLARHAVACFLTRGDLWISWEKGQEVFEEWLLDADWFLNSANWMWLSASAFFHQYFRVYSPVAFGKKTDKNGDYIKKYLPQLKKFPPQYIYEPWKAPLSVQKAADCLIGRDYPRPIVDHDRVRVVNIQRMKQALGGGASDHVNDTSAKPSPSKRKSADGAKEKKTSNKKLKTD